MKKAYKIPSIYVRMVKIRTSMLNDSPNNGFSTQRVKQEENVVFESKTINFAEGWTTSDNEW